MEIEMAEEKSGLVKSEGVWLKDCKFLGMEVFDEGKRIRSKTRSGTSIEIPQGQNTWPDIKALALWNNMNISNMREKYDRLVNTSAFEAGIKYGFLGCLIAESQYKDNPSDAEKRLLIEVGAMDAKCRVEDAKKSFFWKHQDLFVIDPYRGEKKTSDLRLTALSSMCSIRFLKVCRGWRKSRRGRA